MNKADLLDKSAYIQISSYRLKTFNSLFGEEVYKTPTQIARDSGIRTNHISKVLKDLKNINVIQCINPDRRKGKLYCLTEEGHELSNFMSD